MYMYMYRDARYTNCVMEHCYLLQIHTAYMYMCNYTGKCTSAEANDVHLFEGTTLFTQGLHDCKLAQPKRQHLNRPRFHVPLVVDLKKIPLCEYRTSAFKIDGVRDSERRSIIHVC